MTPFEQFAEIAHEIDRRSSAYEFGRLQAIRKALKGLSTRGGAKLPFDRNIEKFAVQKGWVFHFGGGQELQFNIGLEAEGRLRFCVAFSLESSKSTPHPEAIFDAKIKHFNHYLQQHPKVFKGLEMWYSRNNEVRLLDFSKPIAEELVQNGNFIAIGKRTPFRFPLPDSTYQEILETFDRLLPLYEFVEQSMPTEPDNEKRIARICWNDERWQRPSGWEGKSRSNQTHEGKHGWGGEEWLFDFEKIHTDGYHYGYIPSIGYGRSTYAGQILDVSLFSKNSKTKEFVWVGEIKNLEVIDDLEILQSVHDHYKKKGWLNEMERQLQAHGLDTKHFRKVGASSFCLRFKPSDANVYDPPKIIHPDDPLGKKTRYSNLMYFDEPPALLEDIPFQFTPGGNTNITTEDSSAFRSNPGYQIKHLHNEISLALYEYLGKENGWKNVAREHPIHKCNGSADIILQRPSGLVFFEIKTYNTWKACVREAVGQLLEYNFFPTGKRAMEMVVVSSMLPSEQEQAYLENLRKELRLPLFYQCFDLESVTLSKKY